MQKNNWKAGCTFKIKNCIPAQEATELRFIVAVRDRTHLAKALRNLRRTPSVLRVERIKSSG